MKYVLLSFSSSADSRRVVVSYKRKYVHLVLVNYREKRVVRLTDCLDMTIAVDWDVKLQTKTICKGYQHTTKDVCGSALAIFKTNVWSTEMMYALFTI